jgi:hypothetical protein
MGSMIDAIEEKKTSSNSYPICLDILNREHRWIDNGSGKGWMMKSLKIHKNIELRREKRYACSEKVFFATRGRLYEGQLKNYSRTGLFMKTKEILLIGEIITVVDPHPAGGNQKRKGQILWRNDEGFGIEFYRRRYQTEPNVVRFERRSIHSG